MWVNVDKLLTMQRVSDRRGTYTVLITVVPETAEDEYGSAGGFAGFDVVETPEAIQAMLAADPQSGGTPPAGRQ